MRLQYAVLYIHVRTCLWYKIYPYSQKMLQHLGQASHLTHHKSLKYNLQNSHAASFFVLCGISFPWYFNMYRQGSSMSLLPYIHASLFPQTQVLDLRQVELVYGSSFFKSIETGGNVSKALVRMIPNWLIWTYAVQPTWGGVVTIKQPLSQCSAMHACLHVHTLIMK